MSEERVLSALQTLAESSRDQQASPELETKLVAAFLRSRRVRFWKLSGLGAAVAASAVIAVAVVANHMGTSESPNQKALVVEAPRVETDSRQVEAGHCCTSMTETVRGPAIVTEAPRSTAGRGPRVRVPKSVGQPAPEEIATDFFPLMDVAPPFGRGEIVRITVPAAAMQSVGLPVREERLTEFVQADVLLGEEGMARAIRFVNFTY